VGQYGGTARRLERRERKAATGVRIAVCAPQVPFVRGGAEIMAETLVEELRARDHEAALVTLPFKWYPGTRVLDQAFLWRLLDLTESDGRSIDLVLATKFPSYVVRHPNKRVWVLHQFRQAYELDRTELGQFGEEPRDRALRRSVQRLDRIVLGEAQRLFATSRNVADRIERSTGLAAEVLPHPPQDLPYRNDGYGDFVLSVGRLDRAKRNDLLLEAAALDPDLRVVIAGDGPDRERLESLAAERGVNGRAEFAGRVDEAELASLYARCLAVYYAPVDEDFGMVPYEAFLSEKPVLTTTDAGGPLEVVTDGRTGYVTAPEPAELARAAGRLREHPDEAQAYGRAGRELAARVTWDSCIERLLA
jgi:glycosyltransferase involved in cell wall biosynthesis